MTSLDKQSIQSKIARLRRNVRELKKIAAVPYDKYARDVLLTATSERLIQVSVQAMLDIGTHIIAEEALGEPLEYRDVFKLLVKAHILPKDSEGAYINLTGLRNRIVHSYEDIDFRMLHQFLNRDLRDMEDFIAVIAKYLKK